jgi:hypothetical protein
MLVTFRTSFGKKKAGMITDLAGGSVEDVSPGKLEM